MTNPYQSPETGDELPVEPPPSPPWGEPPPYEFRGLLWTHFAMTLASFAAGYSERIPLLRALGELAGVLGPVALASIFLMPLIVLFRCATSGPGHRAIALLATVFMAFASMFGILPAVQ